MTKKNMQKMCETFQEMEYNSSGNSYVLARGEYDGIKFLVINCKGMHPCGYVDVKSTSLNKKDYDTINDIDCHGGLTFSSKTHPLTGESGWWIGWDYGHCDDFIQYPSMFLNEGKKWTTEEVVEECINVIKQVKNNHE